VNHYEVFVQNCARCGEDHLVIFKKFIANPIEDSDGTTWDYWGECPNYREPILLKTKPVVIPDEEGNETA